MSDETVAEVPAPNTAAGVDVEALDAVARSVSITATIQRAAAPVVLIAVVLGGTLAFGSNFASANNFANVALSASFLALIAIGMTFVIISGGIDLSVGSMFALAAVVAAYGSQWGSVVGVTLPVVVCGALGLVQGVLIGRARMAPFIVTLAGLLFARGLAFKISDNGNTTHLIDRDRWMIHLGQGKFFGLGIPTWIVLGVLGLAVIVLNRTRFGQTTFAIGGAEDAATLMGLRVARTKMAIYTAIGALSGLAGMLVAARSSSGLSTIGNGLELEAIASVVIGGTLLTGGAGGLMGTITGVLLLAVIQNLINQVGTLRSFHQQVVSGLFLIVVVTVQAVVSRQEDR